FRRVLFRSRLRRPEQPLDFGVRVVSVARVSNADRLHEHAEIRIGEGDRVAMAVVGELLQPDLPELAVVEYYDAHADSLTNGRQQLESRHREAAVADQGDDRP